MKKTQFTLNDFLKPSDFSGLEKNVIHEIPFGAGMKKIVVMDDELPPEPDKYYTEKPFEDGYDADWTRKAIAEGLPFYEKQPVVEEIEIKDDDTDFLEKVEEMLLEAFEDFEDDMEPSEHVEPFDDRGAVI